MELSGNKILRWYLQESNGMHTKAPNAKCWLVVIDFTVHVVVWYSATNSGVLSNSWFCFQGKLVKVIHMKESMSFYSSSP
jgi:hypothetical protein